MAVFSVHEHELKDDVLREEYEQEVIAILQNLKIDGLIDIYFLKGFKGERNHRYTILWIWKNEQAIIDNFGTEVDPKWPSSWLHYENEVLAKYLTCHPDKINFTDYCSVQKICLMNVINDSG